MRLIEQDHPASKISYSLVISIKQTGSVNFSLVFLLKFFPLRYKNSVHIKLFPSTLNNWQLNKKLFYDLRTSIQSIQYFVRIFMNYFFTEFFWKIVTDKRWHLHNNWSWKLSISISVQRPGHYYAASCTEMCTITLYITHAPTWFNRVCPGILYMWKPMYVLFFTRQNFFVTINRPNGLYMPEKDTRHSLS